MYPLDLIRLYRHYKATGVGVENSRRLIWNHLTKSDGPLQLRSPAGTIGVRYGSTDLLMARDVIWREEYGFRFIREPRVIVDAGANIGAASKYFRVRFPNAAIFAIEPDPENFKMLCLNTRDCNVERFQGGLWPTNCDLRLDFSQNAECAVRTVVADAGEKEGSFHVVSTITPRQLVERFGCIDILKVDIEGAEAELFSSSQDLGWLENVNVIIIELHDRFERGCSRNFWASVTGFPEEAVRGENICVARAGWLLPR